MSTMPDEKLTLLHVMRRYAPADGMVGFISAEWLSKQLLQCWQKEKTCDSFTWCDGLYVNGMDESYSGRWLGYPWRVIMRMLRTRI